MAPCEFRLERFDRRWTRSILDWQRSPEELFNWSARTDFPLTDESVFDRWYSEPGTAAYVLFDGDEPRGYGEIWIDETDGTAELGRLLVSPGHRRQGFGRLLIERLASIVCEAGYREVWVRVMPTNLAARACYASAGFTRASEEQEREWNAGQRVPFLWMVLRTDARVPLVSRK